MAATVTDLANGTSSTSNTVLTTGATVTAAVANKDWLVVIASKHSVAVTISSVTDSSGNTYTERVHGDVGNVEHLYIFTAPVTADITSGTVTVNYSTSTGAGRCVQVYRVRPGSGETISFIGSGNSAGELATSHSTASVSVTNGDIILCGAGVGANVVVTGDSDTTNGSWSSLIQRTLAGGGGDSNCSQYKTVSATGNQAWTVTTVAASGGLTGHIILRSAVSALSLATDSGSYTLTGTTASLIHTQKITAAAGSYTLTGTNATLKHVWKLTAGAGSYALTGTAATPVKAFGSKTLIAGAGSYTLTGTAASLLHKCKIAAGAGSYALTGTAAVLSKHAAQDFTDGRPTIERTGEGYSEENAKEDRRNKWEAEQFRLKLDAMYDGREYVEQPFPEDITPAQRATAAAQAAAERAAMFQAMLTEQQNQQRAYQMAQQFAMRQAQDEEDAATIAVMGD